MDKARILEQLIKEQGYNLKSFAAKCGMPYTTLYGIIKNGVGRQQCQPNMPESGNRDERLGGNGKGYPCQRIRAYL